MNFTTLIKRNLSYYLRSNLAVISGIATAVAVLAGALLVGDSVRASLRDLSLSRLGRTDFIVTANGFFRAQLADDLQSHEKFADKFNGVCPLIALPGVVTRDENNARAGGVQIYGVDERFWKFNGVNAGPPEGNEALPSPALMSEIGAKSGDTILLQIEKPSAIPAESLHSRKDDAASKVRFTVREALPAASMGEFSLRPQQGSVRALFVPIGKLQKNLEQEGKANSILISAKNASESDQPTLRDILKDKFTLADLGLKLRVIDGRVISLESDSAVISDSLAAKVTSKIGQLNGAETRIAQVLTYLANTMSIGERKIPYSLVTALDDRSLAELDHRERGEIDGAHSPSQSLVPSGLILNEWTARDLGAKVGDKLTLEYFVWRSEGRLDTASAQFEVASIVPIQGGAADRNLAPEYPGITGAESLADWDPPFPIDLSRVRKQDEDYWHTYKTTPKAFLRLADGQRLWATRYGKLTSLRFIPKNTGDLSSTISIYEKALRETLIPAENGLSIIPVKQEGLDASRGATDFGQYFTYFSFFLMVSALLLTTLFFKLGIEQRSREVGLLRAIGYSIKRIRSLFIREGIVLAFIGSVLGAIGAVAYGALMMWGLRTWWVGAVGTTLLELHINPLSLLIGGLAGISTALVCIWWTLRKLGPASPRSLLAGKLEEDFGPVRKRGIGARPTVIWLTVLFGLSGIILLAAASMKLIAAVGGFFGAGSLLLIAILCFWSWWLRSDKKGIIQGHGLWPLARLGFRNASTRPGRTVLCIALIASAAFIIVSVDAFRRDAGASASDKKSGTGGYSLVAESLTPIVRDLNSEQGREELNLSTLNDEKMRDVKISRFRLRPGDDSSCLNLYQPRNPRILGASEEFIKAERFIFQTSSATSEAEKSNPWLLLNKQEADGAIPVIADANSLAYVLHKQVGDRITIDADDGSPVKLVFVAALADSIFQSELLMSEKNFVKFFPTQEGWRFFLIDAAAGNTSNISATLEDKLSDFGFDATGAEEKLASFHQVENTYLSTFQTLGGLGLLLGTLGLAAVLLRNVLERRREIALMRAVGYRPSQLSLTVLAENVLMLGCGLLTGVLCALLAIIPALIARGGRLSVVSLFLLLAAVLLTGLVASLLAVRAVNRSPIIPALRTE